MALAIKIAMAHGPHEWASVYSVECAHTARQSALATWRHSIADWPLLHWAGSPAKRYAAVTWMSDQRNHVKAQGSRCANVK